MSLSTHVLDATSGRPATGVALALERLDGAEWRPAGQGSTDEDGRCRDLAPDPLDAGSYRLRFDTGAWFAAAGVTEFFYPEVTVAFRVTEPERHHHVPLLLSPFAYSTYRGS